MFAICLQFSWLPKLSTMQRSEWIMSYPEQDILYCTRFSRISSPWRIYEIQSECYKSFWTQSVKRNARRFVSLWFVNFLVLLVLFTMSYCNHICNKTANADVMRITLSLLIVGPHGTCRPTGPAVHAEHTGKNFDLGSTLIDRSYPHFKRCLMSMSEMHGTVHS